MFLSEWREFPSAPCLGGKKTWWQLASRCCWNRARPWHASELVSFLVGLRTYQHPGNNNNNNNNSCVDELSVFSVAMCPNASSDRIASLIVRMFLCRMSVLLPEGRLVTLGMRFQFLAAASISTEYSEDGGSVLQRNAEGHLSDYTTSYPSDHNMHCVRPCFTKFFFNALCLLIYTT